MTALLTELQAADQLALCPRTLRKARQRGDLPYVLIGRAVRYTPDDLQAFIDRNRQCPSTDEPVHHIGGTRSRSTVVDFEAARSAWKSGKRPR